MQIPASMVKDFSESHDPSNLDPATPSISTQVDNPFRTPPSQSSNTIDNPFGTPRSQSSNRLDNPFRTPPSQSCLGSGISSIGSLYLRESIKGPKQQKFKSARLIGTYEKPWVGQKVPRMVWDGVIFWGLASVGLAIGMYLIYTGWASVENPDYCMVFHDDFSNGINENDWNFEIETGGFGTGSFDWTTNDPQNAYTDAAGLHIVPTLTTESTNLTLEQVTNGYTLNLTAEGVCTGTAPSQCVRVSNSTLGQVINPVRSARLTTQGKHNITYGKIEVVAKMPKGDWLWPAIWMMPEDSVYGAWPASGEIDIMETKGNNGLEYSGGRNTASGTLHWAPASILDAFWRTTGTRYLKRTDFSDAYHTFGVEWSENYIYTWVDTRIDQSLYVPFGKKYGTMYQRGAFQEQSANGSIPADPWSQTGRYNTPFDEAFFLILNVAVGGTNGFFEDGYANKPWVDGSKTAAEQFLNAQSTWEPTWGAGDTRGMTVQSVKMYSRGNCAA
jgi:beta-glucanase (GH16 family)